MTRKQFDTDATAKMFISTQTEDAHTHKPPQGIHAKQEQRDAHIQELTAKAIELERQAKNIKREATQARREAIAAANAKYRGLVTTRYREKPDYDNPRSRRVQLLFRMDVYSRARDWCEENKVSFNAFIEAAVLRYLEQQEGDGQE